jgi:hypothetical protein
MKITNIFYYNDTILIMKINKYEYTNKNYTHFKNMYKKSKKLYILV